MQNLKKVSKKVRVGWTGGTPLRLQQILHMLFANIYYFE